MQWGCRRDRPRHHQATSGSAVIESTTVTLHRRRGNYTHDTITAALDLPDAPVVEQHGAPSLWLNGHLHHDVCRYLEHRHRTSRSPGAAASAGYEIGTWIHWLHQHGLTVRTAAQPHWRAYEADRRWPADGSDGTPDNTWGQHADHINRFHRWLAEHHDIPSPVPVTIKYGPHGPVEGVDHTGGRLADNADDVIPLMPDELTALRHATNTPTPTGREPINAQRDQAIISWMFATGSRVRATTYITIYEVPALRGRPGPFVDHHTAAQINKNKRALTARAFTSGLTHVRRYIHGERALTAAAHPYDPARPLHITTADRRTVTFDTTDGNPVTLKWDQITDTQRTRMVCPDGSAARLFLTTTGRPATTRTIASRIEAAVRNCPPHTIPHGVHPHSLRHTYATTLAALYYRQDPDLNPHQQLHFRTITDAVTFVQRQLGHTSDTTTRAYLGHVERLTRIPSAHLKAAI